MTYYTITLIFIFLLAILVFKFWEYSRKSLLFKSDISKNLSAILQNLENLNKISENLANLSILPNISTQLLTVVHCLDVIVDNTQAFDVVIVFRTVNSRQY